MEFPLLQSFTDWIMRIPLFNSAVIDDLKLFSQHKEVQMTLLCFRHSVIVQLFCFAFSVLFNAFLYYKQALY